MPKITLTDAAAKRLKAPAMGQIDYFDSGYPGLALRVSCGGRKSWNYIYRFAGKPRRMTFDTFPAMTLAGAHEAWRAPEPATDFGSVFEEWMQRDQAGQRSERCVSAWCAKSFICGRIGRSPT
jgi:hypothetical protein